MSEFRDPIPPIVKSHQRLGDEYDVQTVDRGTAHHCIVSNLFYNGQLLLTRTVPYLEKTPADYVRALMDAHNTRLLDELVDGQLDEEIKGVLTAVHARPIEPTLTPMAMPAAGARPAATPPTVTIREGTPRVILMGFAAPSDFLAVHSTRQQQSGLLVDSPLDVALGDKVEVILRFGGQPLRQFMLHGAVAWRPADLACARGGATPSAGRMAARSRVESPSTPHAPLASADPGPKVTSSSSQAASSASRSSGSGSGSARRAASAFSSSLAFEIASSADITAA